MADADAVPDVKVGKNEELAPEHRVRVAVRLRPFNKADKGDTNVCLNVEGNRITADNGQKSSSFTYDYVFHETTQQQVYQVIGETMLQDAFGGYNSTIFAYGQTGSGKTYSMLGAENNPEHEGLLPRICKEMFDLSQELMSEDPTLLIKIQVSFVEVYNEKIRDLLQFEGSGQPATAYTSEDLKDLKLKEDKKHKSFFVDGLSMHTVMNYARIKRLIEDGTVLRTKAETGMNDISSRSHSVFTIFLSQTHEPANPADRDRASRICIVDLAGSERQSKTDLIDAKRQKEAERINMSLLILGRCLNSCSDQSSSNKHIPIRESVLTKMLSDIFGGNAKTLMFAAVSPSMANFGESLSTLQYAYNAKKIKHKAKVNNLGKAIEIKELKEQVKALGKTLIEELEKAAHQKELLDKEIQALNDEKELIASALKSCQEENDLLKEQVAELKRLNKEGVASGAFVRREGSEDRGERVSGDRGTERRPYVEDSDDDENDKEKKLAEVHAELTRKLHLINPTLNSHSMHSHREGGVDTARTSDTTGSTMGSGTTASNEIRSYIGHGAAVYCCSFSPTGERMVSASRDRTLKIWSVKSGNEILTMKGHHGFVLSCCFSPSGNDVVSASDDKTLKIWDARTGKKVLTLKGHNDKVYCCAYSPRGTEIASASCDKTVRIWNAELGKKIITLRGHTSAVFCVNFSHDGTKVVSASDDKTLRVWDWQQSTELNTFQGHTGTVWSCEFNPEDTLILSASMDGTIKLWDVATSFSVRTFRGHSAPVHHALFAKNGTKIISASRDRTLRVWDTESGKVVTTLVGHTNTVYRCCVYNNLILSCSSDDILKVWNLKA
eukprot:NODE_188_length_2767_cov_22.324621_g174_i0.p1 GENE.NODE_188_length_2767_cov_22.324621_g174_i0~~NODE_188_length_2767_cov_22.324621_g174_i0.p1  ORF type:complete len:858 (-),score=316.05 NODE_188_length_2767_cov_22.324621_g174_i0:193-2706(-)